MKRRRNKSGQALIEYAFLLILLATISFAVVILAGNQLQGTFNGVS
jgi:Flp pilus assembly pilin Flp